MAKKENLKLGQHVSFLRSANKAVSLTGELVKIYEEGVPCVDVKLDGHENWIETAHVDDVTILPDGDATKAAAGDTKSAQSLTTVNGVPV